MGIKEELKPVPASVVHSSTQSLSGSWAHQGYETNPFPSAGIFLSCPSVALCPSLSLLCPASFLFSWTFFFSNGLKKKTLFLYQGKKKLLSNMEKQFLSFKLTQQCIFIAAFCQHVCSICSKKNDMKGNIIGAIPIHYIRVLLVWGVSPFPLTPLSFDHFCEFETLENRTFVVKKIGCRVTLCGVQPENSLFTRSR